MDCQLWVSKNILILNSTCALQVHLCWCDFYFLCCETMWQHYAQLRTSKLRPKALNTRSKRKTQHTRKLRAMTTTLCLCLTTGMSFSFLLDVKESTFSLHGTILYVFFFLCVSRHTFFICINTIRVLLMQLNPYTISTRPCRQCSAQINVFPTDFITKGRFLCLVSEKDLTQSALLLFQLTLVLSLGNQIWRPF